LSAVTEEAAANFLAKIRVASANLMPNRDSPVTLVTNFFFVLAMEVITISIGPSSFFFPFFPPALDSSHHTIHKQSIRQRVTTKIPPFRAKIVHFSTAIFRFAPYARTSARSSNCIVVNDSHSINLLSKSRNLRIYTQISSER